MASKTNTRLIEEINALDANFDIEGLTNKELAAKLKELKEPEAPVETEEGPKVHHIAKGKALTSPRGILSEGEEVRLSDYEEDVFNNLLKKGYIE